jgi:adenine phosphoribosyltransferase
VTEAPGTLDLRSYIRDVPDYPRPGIVFRDLTPLLLDAAALEHTVALLSAWAAERPVDYVVAAEARGFILGGAVAARVGAGFIPARKPGKLPAEAISVEYALEYGVDALEMHRDALAGGARVLVHDDLIATGGTAEALCRLVDSAGAKVVGCSFVVELTALRGRERLSGHEVHSLVTYDGG